MQIDIDIATRIVGDAEKVFVVRPGIEFSLYNDFIDRSHVFLDFPGIGLPLDKSFPDRETARAMVARAIAVRDWHIGGRNAFPPNRDLTKYFLEAAGRRIGKYVGALNRLIYELPTGTLVVVPGPDYASDVLVGEITGPATSIRIPTYPNEDIPARPVKWIGRKRKGSLSPELVERLKHRSPLTQLESSLVEDILQIGVDQYIYDGLTTARLRTTKPDFSILDDYDLQSLLNYTAGVMAMIEDGVHSPAGSVSLLQAVAYLRTNRGAIPDFTSNINSPGFLRLIAATTTPIVAAVILSLALSGQAMGSPNDINIHNSKGPSGDTCPMIIQEQVRNTIRMMRLDDLKVVCEQSQAVHKETGLQTSVKTQAKPKATAQTPPPKNP